MFNYLNVFFFNVSLTAICEKIKEPNKLYKDKL